MKNWIFNLLQKILSQIRVSLYCSFFSYVCVWIRSGTHVQSQYVTPRKKSAVWNKSCSTSHSSLLKNNFRKIFHASANVSLRNENSGYADISLEKRSRRVDETAVNMFSVRRSYWIRYYFNSHKNINTSHWNSNTKNVNFILQTY